MKVVLLTRAGNTIRIDHATKPHDDHHPPADPAAVLAAAHAAGFEILGSPRRKPKHFELLGQKKGEFNELHVEPDGHIRKSKDDPKWSAELRSVA